MTDTETYKTQTEEHIKSLKKYADGLWPCSDKEATYDRILRYLIATTEHYLAINDVNLTRPEATITESKLWFAQFYAMANGHGLIRALMKLHELDPSVAEEMAREIWQDANSGDGYGEWLWAWSIEHDVPVHPLSLDGRTQEQAKADHERFLYLQANRERFAKIVNVHLDDVAGISDGIPGPELLNACIPLCASELDEEEVKNGLLQLLDDAVIKDFDKDGKRFIRLATEDELKT